MTTWIAQTMRGRRAAMLLFVAAGMLLAAPAFDAQGIDICGCAAVPGLQPFDSSDSTTFPPGTTDTGFNGTMRIPLPPDGDPEVQPIQSAESAALVQPECGEYTGHDSRGRRRDHHRLVLLLRLFGGRFNRQRRQLLVRGRGRARRAGRLQRGRRGVAGDQRRRHRRHRFRSGRRSRGNGDAVHRLAQAATFLGLPELLPLAGGSGGGGGASTNATSTSCSGGGGGGGGGALLIAANGTLTIVNYQLFADSGSNSGSGNGSCASNGGGGSGGAIRLVANRFAQGGTINLFARSVAGDGTDGRIRLESIDTSAQTQFSTQPTALRVVGPTPIANPINPTVAITSVGGAAVPAVPQGTFGAIDVVLPAPGPTPVQVATSGVPGGTTVSVTVKPRIGGPAISQTVATRKLQRRGRLRCAHDVQSRCRGLRRGSARDIPAAVRPVRTLEITRGGPHALEFARRPWNPGTSRNYWSGGAWVIPSRSTSSSPSSTRS